MNVLEDAEAKLRDLVGYRGHPSPGYSLSGSECEAIALELDRLRGHGAVPNNVLIDIYGKDAKRMAELLEQGAAIRREITALGFKVQPCICHAPHPEQRGSQHHEDCPRYRILEGIAQ